MHPTQSHALAAIAPYCPAIAVTIDTEPPISIDIKLQKSSYKKMTSSVLLSVEEELKPYFPIAKHIRYYEDDQCVGEMPIKAVEDRP